MDASTNLVRGYIRLVKRDDLTKWILFQLTGVVIVAGYRKLQLAVVDSSDADPFANNDPIVLHFTPAGDAGTAAGEEAVPWTVAPTQVAHGYAVGDWLRHNGTSYVKAQADSATNSRAVGVVVEVVDADNFVLQAGGYVEVLSGLSAGSQYYLSPSSAGAITTTEPTAEDQISKPVLFATTTTSGWILNHRGLFVKQSAIEVVIDGGGSAITTGIKGDLEVPFDCVIVAARMLADLSGDLVVDIWKDTYANFPPDNADSITGGNEPEISGNDQSEDTTLSGWTTSLTDGDILRFNVDSVATITRATLSLTVRRTN